jgi:hypothetical protein
MLERNANGLAYFTGKPAYWDPSFASEIHFSTNGKMEAIGWPLQRVACSGVDVPQGCRCGTS